MCGYVAVINTNSLCRLNDIFPDLYTAIQVRGTDGCGIYGVDTNGKVFARRSLSDTVNFMAEKKTAALIENAQVLVGHVRKATNGAITLENTHPFKHKNIVLGHNGVLQNHNLYANKESDSHCATIAIAEHGEDVIKDFEGAFAFLWLENGVFKLARNSRRPLFITKTHHGYIISSEKKLTEWICDRNNIHTMSTEAIPIDEIWTWDKKKEVFNIRDISSKKSWWEDNDYYFSKRNSFIAPQPARLVTKPVGFIPDVKKYTYGDSISFKVISVDKVANLLSGRTDDGKPVRYYDTNHIVLQQLASRNRLTGILSAFAHIKGLNEVTYYVKDVK